MKEMQKMLNNEPKYQNRVERKPDRFELEFFLQYAKDVEDGVRKDELEPEWQWAANVDIVYTWVNGSDPEHLRLKSKYNGGIIKADNRDRCIDELRFSMRSLYKNLPWHRGMIYIVSPGQTPSWLDTNHPRVKVINQDDILPEYDMFGKKVSPTFNSFAIEWFLDQIPGLTDHFIQLNDEYFFKRPVHPSFFFYGGGEGFKYKTRVETYKKKMAKNQGLDVDGDDLNNLKYLDRENRYRKRSPSDEVEEEVGMEDDDLMNGDKAIKDVFEEVIDKRRSQAYFDEEANDNMEKEFMDVVKSVDTPELEKKLEEESSEQQQQNKRSSSRSLLRKRKYTNSMKKEFIQRYIYPNAAQHYRFPNIYLSKSFLGKGFNHARDMARKPFNQTTWVQKFTGALAMTSGCIKEITGKTTLINMLEHAPYVWYRDMYKVTRKEYAKYVNMTLTHKFRHPLDFIPPFANQFYLRFYATGEKFEEDIMDKTLGTKYYYDAYFDGDLDSDQPKRNIMKYGFHIMDYFVSSKILTFGAVFDDPERNKRFFRSIIESKTLLFFNLNDDYTELEAGDQLHQFMEYLYPDPCGFEKQTSLN